MSARILRRHAYEYYGNFLMEDCRTNYELLRLFHMHMPSGSVDVQVQFYWRIMPWWRNWLSSTVRGELLFVDAKSLLELGRQEG